MMEQGMLDDGTEKAGWWNRGCWMTERGMLDGGAEKAGWLRDREHCHCGSTS